MKKTVPKIEICFSCDNLSKFSKGNFFPLFKDLNCSGITFQKDWNWSLLTPPSAQDPQFPAMPCQPWDPLTISHRASSCQGLHSVPPYEGWGWGRGSIHITLRDGVFPAVSINKDVTAISDSGPPNVNFWAWRVPRKNNVCCLTAIKLQPPLRSTEALGDAKNCRTLAPDSWKALERNDFLEPRFLPLPVHRKH